MSRARWYMSLAADLRGRAHNEEPNAGGRVELPGRLLRAPSRTSRPERAHRNYARADPPQLNYNLSSIYRRLWWRRASGTPG